MLDDGTLEVGDAGLDAVEVGPDAVEDLIDEDIEVGAEDFVVETTAVVETDAAPGRH